MIVEYSSLTRGLALLGPWIIPNQNFWVFAFMWRKLTLSLTRGCYGKQANLSVALSTVRWPDIVSCLDKWFLSFVVTIWFVNICFLVFWSTGSISAQYILHFCIHVKKTNFVTNPNCYGKQANLSVALSSVRWPDQGCIFFIIWVYSYL